MGRDVKPVNILLAMPLAELARIDSTSATCVLSGFGWGWRHSQPPKRPARTPFEHPRSRVYLSDFAAAPPGPAQPHAEDVSGGAASGATPQLSRRGRLALGAARQLPDIGRLAAACRLLQYGQSTTHAFTPIEDALRLRTERRGWSVPRPLPVETREAVKYLLRLAWQDGLQFHCMAAARETHLAYLWTQGMASCGAAG